MQFLVTRFDFELFIQFFSLLALVVNSISLVLIHLFDYPSYECMWILLQELRSE